MVVQVPDRRQQGETFLAEQDLKHLINLHHAADSPALCDGGADLHLEGDTFAPL